MAMLFVFIMLTATPIKAENSFSPNELISGESTLVKSYECQKGEGPESWVTIKSLSGHYMVPPKQVIAVSERQREIYQINGYNCE